MKVFLAGEGRAELGEWANHPNYRQTPPQGGLIEALLGRVRNGGWTVTDAVCWKDIRKYQIGAPCPAEVRNVMGAALRAREAGCDVLAFTRDRDGDHQREKDIASGIDRAEQEVEGCPAIIGGVAIEAIESWVASAAGNPRAEQASHPKELLADSSLESKRAILDGMDLARIPRSATSMHRWLDRAAEVLTAALAAAGEQQLP